MRKLNGLIFNTSFIKVRLILHYQKTSHHEHILKGYCSERYWVKKSLEYLYKTSTEDNNREVNLEVLTLIQILSLFHISPLELKILFQATQSEQLKVQPSFSLLSFI